MINLCGTCVHAPFCTGENDDYSEDGGVCVHYRRNKDLDTVNRFNAYLKDRDEAVRSMDIDTFKAFINKHKPVFASDISDEVIEITMRKMAVHITSIDIDTRVNAFRWLLEHGYDFDLE